MCFSWNISVNMWQPHFTNLINYQNAVGCTWYNIPKYGAFHFHIDTCSTQNPNAATASFAHRIVLPTFGLYGRNIWNVFHNFPGRSFYRNLRKHSLWLLQGLVGRLRSLSSKYISKQLKKIFWNNIRVRRYLENINVV